MTQERTIQATSGWIQLPINLGMVAGGAVVFVMGAATASGTGSPVIGGFFCFCGVVLGLAGLICLGGHFTLQPNEACVLSFFGPYVGTVRESGFYWVNPFYSKKRVSLQCGQSISDGATPPDLFAASPYFSAASNFSRSNIVDGKIGRLTIR